MIIVPLNARTLAAVHPLSPKTVAADAENEQKNILSYPFASFTLARISAKPSVIISIPQGKI